LILALSFINSVSNLKRNISRDNDGSPSREHWSDSIAHLPPRLPLPLPLRWHIDAALYDLSPPRVTSLYALKVPQGEPQLVVYDDGSNQELPVPKGTTAFVSGLDMFESLSKEDKSLVVRCTAAYSPHPYVWMSKARSNSVGLGLESEGLELEEKDLPEWDQSKVKELPMVSEDRKKSQCIQYI